MDCFIKKIFEGKSDELVHLQFQKFSRGEFKNRAMIKAGNSKGKYSIATTYEYASDFVRSMAEKLGDSKTKVTGGVITTADLTGKLEFVDKKQFMGVKQYVMDKEMNGEEIIKLCDDFKTAFIALSFVVGDSELKIKAKAPKNAKPSTKGDAAPKPDFCKLITTDKDLIKSVLFDINLEGFKKVNIGHNFQVLDIIVPKDEKDFAKMRELAKRKGKIIRTLDVDDMKSQKEVEFLA